MWSITLVLFATIYDIVINVLPFVVNIGKKNTGYNILINVLYFVVNKKNIGYDIVINVCFVGLTLIGS